MVSKGKVNDMIIYNNKKVGYLQKSDIQNTPGNITLGC